MTLSSRLWLIGGTSESVALAIAFTHQHLPCTVSVTTAAAQARYPQNPLLRVVVGQFQPEDLPAFLEQEQIGAILDASHPYATEISQLAITMAAEYHLPYLRFERGKLTGSTPGSSDSAVGSVASLATWLAGANLLGQRVLLTLGSKALPQFLPWQERCTLFARILPTSAALQAAASGGFKRDRLFALFPPISHDLERALWQHWQISMVVTKASGQPGGEAIKRQVAAELGVTLIVIQRPPLVYPQQTSNLEAAIAFGKQWVSGPLTPWACNQMRHA
jgi:precorrin-6A/cobalt-precorrin-6A reductase